MQYECCSAITQGTGIKNVNAVEYVQYIATLIMLTTMYELELASTPFLVLVSLVQSHLPGNTLGLSCELRRAVSL